MDKNERKEHSLPSNMLPQIFDALVEVVERKSTAAVGGGGFGTSNINVLSTPLQHPIPAAAQSMLLPLPPPAQPTTRPFAEPSLPTVAKFCVSHATPIKTPRAFISSLMCT
ncbi:trihelix transcription factor ASR3-like [Forsythia ovata]|uniref:Trihelix transcription factor ASR3-like n=1 Tax=Forsythia ovata TaxID=205694 RepID=A0ABD1S001_9LAMI